MRTLPGEKAPCEHVWQHLSGRPPETLGVSYSTGRPLWASTANRTPGRRGGRGFRLGLVPALGRDDQFRGPFPYLPLCADCRGKVGIWYGKPLLTGVI